MPASYGASSLPFGGQSTSHSLADRLAFLRSVLSNRRIAVVLTQLGVLLCVVWLILGSPFSSADDLGRLPLSSGDLTAALEVNGGGSSYRGTFDPTTCPASGNCPYTAFATPFDRIRNGTVGPTYGMPIDQDRSKYENDGIMFNPAILRMPPGARYELAILTRGPSMFEYEPAFLQRRTVIAYFADLEQGVDVVQKTDSWMFDLQTDASPGCEFPWGATPGPEDPRAVWSPEGVPLMIVGVDTLRPEACRMMAVMDLRTLWPTLRDELERLSWPTAEEARKSASELQQGTEIWFDGIREREKNWAGFFSPFQPSVHVGSLPLPAFHYDFHPQSLLLPNTTVKTPAGLDLLPYEKFVPSESGEPSVLRACMDRIQGTDEFQPVGFKVADHHATPFHPVTLRGRGTGKKRRTPADTILVGLAHAKFFDDKKESHFWYDRYVIILNATAPFKPIAVSPYLNISSLSYESFYFTQSITFLPRHGSLPPPSTEPSRSPFFPLNLFVPPAQPAPPQTNEPSLSDGYLDDDVLIAMGEADGLMGSVRMRLDHMLSGMIGCGPDADVFDKLLRSNAV